MNCNQTPDCTGTYDADGYCDQCGMKMSDETSVLPGPPIDATPQPPAPGSTPSVSASSPSSTSTHRWGSAGPAGGGLVELPPVESVDPATLVLTDPQVAEDHRFCRNSACNAPVGRGHDGRPGRTEGFCPKCRTEFSFVPRLAQGDLVGGQYEIEGCLAHGGLGWIYLARDRNVDDVWRVLKGVLHRGDDQAAQNAIDERRFLATVNHPNIVKIINFVVHEGDGYIVMEYVDGASLRQLVRDRVATNNGRANPVPVTEAIAYIIEILPALGYLHDRGLLFCDFKPDNVMRTGNTLKLIDLGAVYRKGDDTSPVYGTPGFQAPEIAHTGPTVPSDLWTVGRTLAVLATDFSGFQQTYRYTIPGPDVVPEYARHDSLYRVILRATAMDPAARFQSAGEMTDQLIGVLREIVAAETGRPTPGVSANFTGKVRGHLDGPEWRALPVPLVDLDDPAAGYLATVAALDAEALVDALQRAPEHTLEVDLQLVRALLDVGRDNEVEPVLDVLVAGTNDWRRFWYQGLMELATRRSAAAIESFTIVYQHVPGELAPKFAMATALELHGEPNAAVPWYDLVSRTDPSFTAAAFGLARCYLATGDPATAAAAYDRVPDTSSAYIEAQVARARALLQIDDFDAVREAGSIVERLTPELDAGRRADLTVAVLERALPLVTAHVNSAPAPSILGAELTDAGVRVGLERNYRVLAKHAGSQADRIRLVDHANRVRPRTLT
jgi:serine/threonine-protein kinase PknG